MPGLLWLFAVGHHKLHFSARGVTIEVDSIPLDKHTFAQAQRYLAGRLQCMPPLAAMPHVSCAGDAPLVAAIQHLAYQLCWRALFS